MRINHYFKIILIAIIMIFSCITSGCWDRREIENRGYVLGVAIDYTDPLTAEKKPDLLHTAQTAGMRKYHVTYELPRFRKKESSQATGGGAEQHILLAADGESMFAVTRSIASKVYFPPYFEHMQLIVVSEDVARDGIRDVIDFYLRDPEMRRRAKVAVSTGRAEAILKSNVPTEEVTSSFIYKMAKNDVKTPTFAMIDDIGKISMAIAENRGFVLPIIIENGKEIKLEKGALFNRQQKMVGELSELEVTGNKILRNKLRQGILNVPNPMDKNKLIAFELFQSDIKVDSHVQGSQVWLTVQAKFTGNIGEMMDGPGDIFDAEFISTVENAVAQEYTRLVYAAYTKQQQLHVEVSELGEIIHHQHPRYWGEIKERWEDEIFPTVPLEVDIKVTIVRSAMLR